MYSFSPVQDGIYAIKESWFVFSFISFCEKREPGSSPRQIWLPQGLWPEKGPGGL